MRGIIVHNGSLCTDSFMRLCAAFEEAFAKLGAQAMPVSNTMILPARINGVPLLCGLDFRPDFALFYDKDIRLAEHIESMGVPVFNSSRAIALCDDKTACMNALSGLGIPTADSVFSPLVFNGSAEFSLERVAELLGLPLVVKENCGSFGAQVYLARSLDELKQLYERLRFVPHRYERFINAVSGQDYRIQIVGGEYAGCMKRVNRNDFRANVYSGGSVEAFEPPESAVCFAKRACSVLKLDFAGVDFLFASDGSPVLCEVNSNAFFLNLSKVSSTDVAFMTARHIIRKTDK